MLIELVALSRLMPDSPALRKRVRNILDHLTCKRDHEKKIEFRDGKYIGAMSPEDAGKAAARSIRKGDAEVLLLAGHMTFLL
ncbi:MAG TPA: hypothetical protein VKG64_00965 [Methylomirabilota bacterium]|jgi:hypothetical protein|nr:hypothetical protein [Methylomirabilota bacterium]